MASRKNISKMVYTGDSLIDNTWTMNYTNSQFFNWTNIMSRELLIDSVNTAIAGTTIEYVSNNIQSLVIDHHPSHCIIDGGANDIWWALSSEDSVVRWMQLALRAMQNEGIVPILLWIPVDNTVLNLRSLSGLPAKYQSMSQYMGVEFINMEGSDMGSTPNVNHSMKVIDGVHNNNKGNLYVAEFVKNFILSNVVPFDNRIESLDPVGEVLMEGRGIYGEVNNEMRQVMVGSDQYPDKINVFKRWRV